MTDPDILSSLQNSRVKQVVRLRKRKERDSMRMLLVEGYRELLRAAEQGYKLDDLYVCPEWFLGSNEDDLIIRHEEAGARVHQCSREVFAKMSYRDRPDGLLGLGPYLQTSLAALPVVPNGLYLVAESIEKPGNLGTLLRSADAAGVDGVIVADPQTDLHNPNVVRASVGTLFTVPVAEASTSDTLAWLAANGIRPVATTPDTDTLHYNADLTGGIALVVGAEQYGLSTAWLEGSPLLLRIPMAGKADSLNVAAAATIVLFESVRQRNCMEFHLDLHSANASLYVKQEPK